MENFISLYSHYILHRLLRIQIGDKLSINCTEESLRAAHKIAHEAANFTQVETYIVFIEDGKVSSTELIKPDCEEIEATSVAMLNLACFNTPDNTDDLSIVNLQEFKLLSEPIDTERRISVPWAVCYYPTLKWAEFCFGPGATVEQLELALSEILDFENLYHRDTTKHLHHATEVRIDDITSFNPVKIILKSSTCELELPIAKTSRVITSSTNVKGRTFYSYCANNEITFTLDYSKANGKFSTTYPFRLFNKIFNNASFELENGVITNYKTDDDELFSKFLSIDKYSSKVGCLNIVDEYNNHAFFKSSLAIPELDRARSTSLTLGGVFSDALTTDKDLSFYSINTSDGHLELPLGSRSLSIVLVNNDDEEKTILLDGELV